MTIGRPRSIPDDKADEILQRIESGESQASISLDLGVATGTLSAYLNSDTLCERSARARELSAEAWLDKGLAAIQSALQRDSGIDSNAARAYAQECARRAAIRNPRYNEKLKIEHSGKVQTNQALTEAELLAIAAKGKGGDA